MERELSELSEGGIAAGVLMETQTCLCRRSEYHNLLSKCRTKTHERARPLPGEKRGLGEAISEEVAFKHNPFVCTHKLTKQKKRKEKKAIVSFPIFFYFFFYAQFSE